MTYTKKIAVASVDLVTNTTTFDKGLADSTEKVRGFSSKTKENISEAKGAIMVLGEEIGVHLPRHVQTYLAKLPGVASMTSVAFAPVMVIGLGVAIVEVGKKIYEFVEKNEEAARKNVEAWRSIEQPLQATNDQLRVTNDKLENAIAKMEHRPENGLKLAIDDAIVSAITLGDKLTADAGKITNVLKQQEVGWISRIAGNSGNSDVTKRARSLQTTLEDIETQDANLDKSGMSKEEIDAQRKALSGQYRKEIRADIDWTETELGKLTYQPDYSDKPKKIAILGQTERQSSLTDYQSAATQLSLYNSLSETNSIDVGRKARLDAIKDAASEAAKNIQKQL